MKSTKTKRLRFNQLLLKLVLGICLFQIPNPTVGQTFDILQGRKKIEIPFAFHHNFIIIESRLFGILPMKFIFDTGAEHIILFKRHYTDVMNVEYDRRIPIIGADLSTRVYALVARNIQLTLQDLPMIEKDILVLETDYFKLEEVTGTQIDGIIGGEFFKNLIVNINYHKQRITVYDPDYFNQPGKSFEKLDIRIKANKPYIFTDVGMLNGSSHELELLIDSGSGIPLLIHNNTSEGLGLPKKYITGNLGIGIGGAIEGYVGRVETLKFGNHTFQNLLTNFQDVSEKISIDDGKFRNGLIGNEILSRFHVYLDYLNQDLYIKPNRRFRRKFKTDKSGLMVFATGTNLNVYVVQDVIQGSPSEEGGILVGDIIKKMQGIPTKFMSLESILRKMQRKTGKSIRMHILRDGKVLKKEFLLRELI